MESWMKSEMYTMILSVNLSLCLNWFLFKGHKIIVLNKNEAENKKSLLQVSWTVNGIEVKQGKFNWHYKLSKPWNHAIDIKQNPTHLNMSKDRKIPYL